MEHTGIAVLESNWFPDRNVSVRSLFELIANLNCANPNAYHYEMANSKSAIKEAIPRIGSYKRCNYLYIAMHGNDEGLVPLSNEVFSRTELRNTLCAIKRTAGSSLQGVHLGSCWFGSESLAKFLFDKDVGVSWIAGYDQEIGWVESSALDLLFFNELMQKLTQHDGKRRSNPIEGVANQLASVAPGLVKNLGFAIFVRKRDGDIKNLLAPDDDE